MQVNEEKLRLFFKRNLHTLGGRRSRRRCSVKNVTEWPINWLIIPIYDGNEEQNLIFGVLKPTVVSWKGVAWWVN